MIKITDVEKVTEETLERDFAEFEKSELGDLKEQNKDVCGKCGKPKGEHINGLCYSDFERLKLGRGFEKFEPEPKEPSKDVCRHCDMYSFKEVMAIIQKARADGFKECEEFGSLDSLKTDDFERLRRKNGLKPKKVIPEDLPPQLPNEGFCAYLRRLAPFKDVEISETDNSIAKEEAIKREYIKAFLAMRKAEGKTNVSVMEIAEITKVDAEKVEDIMQEIEGVKEAQDEEVCKNCGQRIVHIKADTYVHMTQKESCLRPEPKEPSKDVCRNCGVEIISIEEAIKRMNEMKGVKEAQDEEKPVTRVAEKKELTEKDFCKNCAIELHGLRPYVTKYGAFCCLGCAREYEHNLPKRIDDMCKRELKGAIRTVAGSMPAAAINEEQAVAEFEKKLWNIKRREYWTGGKSMPYAVLHESEVEVILQAARNMFRKARGK